MATLARVKWKAGDYPGSDGGKYLAELSYFDAKRLVKKDPASDLTEHESYECKIELYRTRQTTTPETIYKNTFSSLQSALNFFNSLVSATGAQHCDHTREHDFVVPLSTNKELSDIIVKKLDEAVQQITGSIGELAEATARSK
ncbi:hypothetical protein [Pantoea agglomerans]|uniref:hypothetical protein n=1 Tax=Enterobacter agglomerans TaxID=549 RepID=UPI003C798B25